MAKKAGSKRVVRTKSSTQSKSKIEIKKTSSANEVHTSSAVSKVAMQMPFTRKNYLLLLAGIGLIALGFFLMSIEDFKDASEFSIALNIAPFLVVGGFVEVIFAIMYQEKKGVADQA